MTPKITFDTPMSDAERAEVAAMPSHELYLLTKMVPPMTARGREVNALYRECIDRAGNDGSRAGSRHAD